MSKIIEILQVEKEKARITRASSIKLGIASDEKNRKSNKINELSTLIKRPKLIKSMCKNQTPKADQIDV